jgi:hypothetical protein
MTPAGKQPLFQMKPISHNKIDFQIPVVGVKDGGALSEVYIKGVREGQNKAL